MIQKVSIKSLTLLENNPRKINKDQFDKLCKSLQEDPGFFDLRPCLVNEICTDDSGKAKKIVYAGNQRVLAAKKLKWHEVPCIVESDLNEEVMKKRVIRDNAHYGTFDYDILANEWEIGDLLDCGLTMDELQLEVQDLGSVEENREEKERKLKMCPSCGHEF